MSQKSEQPTQMATLKANKEKLEALKGTENWNDSLQEQLDLIYGQIADLEEEQQSQPAKYTPEPGSEKHIHLLIAQGGVRYNQKTGKDETERYRQIFTKSEWDVFKGHFMNLGYAIIAVLHDPYGEAAAYVK